MKSNIYNSFKILKLLNLNSNSNFNVKRKPKNSTSSGTRTHNLFLRREAPYPLGHAGESYNFRSHLYLISKLTLSIITIKLT